MEWQKKTVTEQIWQLKIVLPRNRPVVMNVFWYKKVETVLYWYETLVNFYDQETSQLEAGRLVIFRCIPVASVINEPL